MKASSLLINKQISCMLSLMLWCVPYCLHGQSPVYSYFYRVYLRDKGEIVPGAYSAAPKGFLVVNSAGNERTSSGVRVRKLVKLKN